ncbi:MAG: TetR/AcrR family transcriptional regulator [Velocimicrobium sp.]
MKEETGTKEKLLVAAKEEFMEKGYTATSLRSICKKADVTTGALYFFFQHKEDLFGSLVQKPLEKLYELMKLHYEGELQVLKQGIVEKGDYTENSEAANFIVIYMFQYHDEFKLLLTKSDGSRYENCIDEFVEITQVHYRILADAMSKKYQVERIDDYTLHWFAHLQIFTFSQFITHNVTKEEALVQIKTNF